MKTAMIGESGKSSFENRNLYIPLTISVSL